MSADLSVVFTGIQFENPFLLASAPPTESDTNIMRAFAAGWGGVVTKTIGLHPVVNVAGPKTKFLRATPESYHLSMQKRPNTALHSSWNWELISDRPLDWWVGRLSRIKKAHPAKVLVASIMAGSGNIVFAACWRERFSFHCGRQQSRVAPVLRAAHRCYGNAAGYPWNVAQRLDEWPMDGA